MLGLFEIALGLPAVADVGEFPVVQLGHRDALGGPVELAGHGLGQISLAKALMRDTTLAGIGS